MMTPIHYQQGFVLITGLVFLVVITLLAVSSMGTSTLQEKMATNLREQARAQEASDAALREGESRIARFTTYPQAEVDYDFDPTPAQPGNNDDVTWHLWAAGGPLSGTDIAEFLDAELWEDDPNDATDPVPSNYSLPFDATLIQPPQMYIEEADFRARDLNPDTNARAEGQALYRITGRAQGGTASAVAVTQSIYMKRY